MGDMVANIGAGVAVGYALLVLFLGVLARFYIFTCETWAALRAASPKWCVVRPPPEAFLRFSTHALVSMIATGAVTVLVFGGADWSDNHFMRKYGMNTLGLFMHLPPSTYVMPTFWLFTAVCMICYCVLDTERLLQEATSEWCMVIGITTNGIFALVALVFPVAFVMSMEDSEAFRELPFMLLVMCIPLVYIMHIWEMSFKHRTSCLAIVTLSIYVIVSVLYALSLVALRLKNLNPDYGKPLQWSWVGLSAVCPLATYPRDVMLNCCRNWRSRARSANVDAPVPFEPIGSEEDPEEAREEAPSASSATGVSRSRVLAVHPPPSLPPPETYGLLQELSPPATPPSGWPQDGPGRGLRAAAASDPLPKQPKPAMVDAEAQTSPRDWPKAQSSPRDLPKAQTSARDLPKAPPPPPPAGTSGLLQEPSASPATGVSRSREPAAPPPPPPPPAETSGLLQEPSAFSATGVSRSREPAAPPPPPPPPAETSGLLQERPRIGVDSEDVKIPGPSHIFVSTSAGRFISIDLDDSDTTADIKLKIQNEEGTPLCQQRLSFEGKLMEDGRPVSFYEIQDEDILSLELLPPAEALMEAAEMPGAVPASGGNEADETGEGIKNKTTGKDLVRSLTVQRLDELTKAATLVVQDGIEKQPGSRHASIIRASADGSESEEEEEASSSQSSMDEDLMEEV